MRKVKNTQCSKQDIVNCAVNDLLLRLGSLWMDTAPGGDAGCLWKPVEYVDDYDDDDYDDDVGGFRLIDDFYGDTAS